jgi:hypothetical protein
LIIIIGILRFAEIEKYLPKDEEDLFACTIVNIDNNAANENYGDINIIEESPISRIATILIKELSESSFSKEVFDFLFFGFFSQEKISIKDIPAIKFITGNRGTADFYFEYQKKEKPIWTNNFETALKNISFEENSGIVFSYLPNIENEDLEQKNQKIKNILQVSKIFREWLSPKTFFISFTEDGQTKTIFYSSSALIITKISSQYKGKFKETGGIIITEKEPKETMEELRKKL